MPDHREIMAAQAKEYEDFNERSVPLEPLYNGHLAIEPSHRAVSVIVPYWITRFVCHCACLEISLKSAIRR